jgi:hypothetical protein
VRCIHSTVAVPIAEHPIFRPRKAIALQLGAPSGSPVPRYGNIPVRCGSPSTLPTMVRGTLGLPGRASPIVSWSGRSLKRAGAQGSGCWRYKMRPRHMIGGWYQEGRQVALRRVASTSSSLATHSAWDRPSVRSTCIRSKKEPHDQSESFHQVGARPRSLIVRQSAHTGVRSTRGGVVHAGFGRPWISHQADCQPHLALLICIAINLHWSSLRSGVSRRS